MKRYLSSIILGLAMCLWSGSAVADGGWISSGGEIYKNGRNPWFVENTGTVRYCVDIDQKSISARAAHIEELSARAIANWKREFEKYYAAGLFAEFKVATQDFVQVECDQNPAFKIQLGWGTLNFEQRRYLKSLGAERLVGLAVRTEYDDVSLRGRGFIYIASDLGDHRYNGGADTVERAWQYDALLYFVIAHELGHVFGVPHVSPDGLVDISRSLMAEHFPEYLMRKTAVERLRQTPGFDLNRPNDFNDFFVLPNEREQCRMSPYGRYWFGVPKEADCIRFQRLDEKSYLVFAAGPRVPEQLIGQIEVTDLRRDHDSLLTLYLDARQTVYPPNGAWPTLFGPGFSFETVVGVYRPMQAAGFSATQAAKAIAVTFDEKLIVMGEDSGQMVFVLR